MLRSGSKRPQLLSPDRQKDPSRRLAQRSNCILGVGNIDPDIAIHWSPGWPAQSEYLHVRSRRCVDGIHRNCLGVRVRRIDENIDLMGAKVFSQSFGAAKATSAHGDRLSSGRDRASGERNRRDEVTGPKSEPKLTGFCGTSENQYVRAHG
jgi:hypothetical protein